MMIRSYSDLIQLPTFEERYDYLRLRGIVGAETFGFDRIFNQMFYRSDEWKFIRGQVIARDLGCDLGIHDRDIFDRIVVHHMNPISIDDIRNSTEFLMDPEYLITTSDMTHKAIHYGTDNVFKLENRERRPYDTCPWKRKEGGANGREYFQDNRAPFGRFSY